jgi:hypothetical protein
LSQATLKSLKFNDRSKRTSVIISKTKPPSAIGTNPNHTTSLQSTMPFSSKTGKAKRGKKESQARRKTAADATTAKAWDESGMLTAGRQRDRDWRDEQEYQKRTIRRIVR